MTTSVSRSQSILSTFQGYRSQLDDFNERRERLIVTSRQITSLSKKLIFHLHRISLLGNGDAKKDAREELMGEAEEKEKELLGWLVKVRDELRDAESSGGTSQGASSYWGYSRNISGGLQEYIEAISFMRYLKERRLISKEEVQMMLRDQETGEELFKLPAEEYALGISDLTGELMRYATNCSSSGDHATALHVCAFVRGMKAELDAAQPFVKDLAKKQAVTQQSLVKIENICYTIQLRIMEYSDRPDVLERLAKRALEDSDRMENSGEDGAGGGQGGGGENRQNAGAGASRGRGGAGGRGRGRGRGGGPASDSATAAPLDAADEERTSKRGRVDETRT